jgi:hypothetical protein
VLIFNFALQLLLPRSILNTATIIPVPFSRRPDRDFDFDLKHHNRLVRIIIRCATYYMHHEWMKDTEATMTEETAADNMSLENHHDVDVVEHRE